MSKSNALEKSSRTDIKNARLSSPDEYHPKQKHYYGVYET
jgi:hypothetical protein